MHLKGGMPFILHKIIFFFSKKCVCLTYLKVSDPLPKTHLFFYLALVFFLIFQSPPDAPAFRRIVTHKKAKVRKDPPKLNPRTRYMHHPPPIMPNYGKRKELGVPKTSLSRVLLYDNITQQQMLDVKLAHIKIEKQRVEKQMNLHRHSFNYRMKQKRQHQQQNKHATRRFLPPIARTGSQHTKGEIHLNEPSFTLEDVRLPRKRRSGKEIIFRIKTKNGSTAMYHSFDDKDLFTDFFPLHTFFPTIKDDPRFRNLQNTLVRMETCLHFAGFVELSPSYNKFIPKVPTFLCQIEEENLPDSDETH